MATDIRTSELRQPIDIAEYLFTRLKQIGVDSIHGLPGDYNLVALDYVSQVGLKWVGNANELNAGMLSFLRLLRFYPSALQADVSTDLWQFSRLCGRWCKALHTPNLITRSNMPLQYARVKGIGAIVTTLLVLFKLFQLFVCAEVVVNVLSGRSVYFYLALPNTTRHFSNLLTPALQYRY